MPKYSFKLQKQEYRFDIPVNKRNFKVMQQLWEAANKGEINELIKILNLCNKKGGPGLGILRYIETNSELTIFGFIQEWVAIASSRLDPNKVARLKCIEAYLFHAAPEPFLALTTHLGKVGFILHNDIARQEIQQTIEALGLVVVYSEEFVTEVLCGLTPANKIPKYFNLLANKLGDQCPGSIKSIMSVLKKQGDEVIRQVFQLEDGNGKTLFYGLMRLIERINQDKFLSGKMKEIFEAVYDVLEGVATVKLSTGAGQKGVTKEQCIAFFTSLAKEWKSPAKQQLNDFLNGEIYKSIAGRAKRKKIETSKVAQTVFGVIGNDYAKLASWFCDAIELEGKLEALRGEFKAHQLLFENLKRCDDSRLTLWNASLTLERDKRKSITLPQHRLIKYFLSPQDQPKVDEHQLELEIMGMQMRNNTKSRQVIKHELLVDDSELTACPAEDEPVIPAEEMCISPLPELPTLCHPFTPSVELDQAYEGSQQRSEFMINGEKIQQLQASINQAETGWHACNLMYRLMQLLVAAEPEGRHAECFYAVAEERVNLKLELLPDISYVFKVNRDQVLAIWKETVPLFIVRCISLFESKNNVFEFVRIVGRYIPLDLDLVPEVQQVRARLATLLQDKHLQAKKLGLVGNVLTQLVIKALIDPDLKVEIVNDIDFVLALNSDSGLNEVGFLYHFQDKLQQVTDNQQDVKLYQPAQPGKCLGSLTGKINCMFDLTVYSFSADIPDPLDSFKGFMFVFEDNVLSSSFDLIYLLVKGLREFKLAEIQKKPASLAYAIRELARPQNYVGPSPEFNKRFNKLLEQKEFCELVAKAVATCLTKYVRGPEQSEYAYIASNELLLQHLPILQQVLLNSDKREIVETVIATLLQKYPNTDVSFNYFPILLWSLCYITHYEVRFIDRMINLENSEKRCVFRDDMSENPLPPSIKKGCECFLNIMTHFVMQKSFKNNYKNEELLLSLAAGAFMILQGQFPHIVSGGKTQFNLHGNFFPSALSAKQSNVIAQSEVVGMKAGLM